MREQYYLKGDGFVLVYSIENKGSFLAIGSHKDSIETIRPEGQVALILAGNKCDLVDQRAVTKEEGQELAKEYGIDFFETSAAKRINVNELFIQLGRKLLQIHNKGGDAAPAAAEEKKGKKDKGDKKTGGCTLL